MTFPLDSCLEHLDWQISFRSDLKLSSFLLCSTAGSTTLSFFLSLSFPSTLNENIFRSLRRNARPGITQRMNWQIDCESLSLNQRYPVNDVPCVCFRSETEKASGDERERKLADLLSWAWDHVIVCTYNRASESIYVYPLPLSACLSSSVSLLIAHCARL